MKPWICEDSELGGRELGGNTVFFFKNYFRIYLIQTVYVNWIPQDTLLSGFTEPSGYTIIKHKKYTYIAYTTISH